MIFSRFCLNPRNPRTYHVHENFLSYSIVQISLQAVTALLRINCYSYTCIQLNYRINDFFYFANGKYVRFNNTQCLFKLVKICHVISTSAQYQQNNSLTSHCTIVKNKASSLEYSMNSYIDTIFPSFSSDVSNKYTSSPFKKKLS